MRPRTDVPPMFRTGASASGVSNDALINILLSLTVGKRWRKPPASHVALAGAVAEAACANRSAGTVRENAVAAEPRRNCRRLPEGMADASVFIAGPNHRLASQRMPSRNRGQRML